MDKIFAEILYQIFEFATEEAPCIDITGTNWNDNPESSATITGRSRDIRNRRLLATKMVSRRSSQCMPNGSLAAVNRVDM